MPLPGRLRGQNAGFRLPPDVRLVSRAMAEPIPPLSGFPEWLPAQRLAEQLLLDQIRRRFELAGFVSIETRAVEPLRVLLAKGETDKEVYVLRRLHAEPGEDSDLGLHFDLTVPFARYVAQHRGQLSFPIRRYQIQKAWRGERPQEGRYREFTQADVDVIGEGTLGIHHDAELIRLLAEVLAALPIPPVRLLVNHRKLLEGAYRALGIEAVADVLRAADKLDKIGDRGVAKILTETLGLSQDVADRCLALARIRGDVDAVAAGLRQLELSHPLIDAGLADLRAILDASADLPEGRLVADLRIARGLDYYTGMVCEGQLVGHEQLGSVCSGGRYDNLASGMGVDTPLPGVGVSIGVTRLVGRLFSKQLLRASRATPSCVLVALISDETRGVSQDVARRLRARDIACEVFDRPIKLGKQIRQAEQRGIPFVWFPPMEPGATHGVRDIRSGEQVDADPDAWEPPAEDRAPRLVGA
jgi:histidyl-tRNA synthetase